VYTRMTDAANIKNAFLVKRDPHVLKNI
jgi:hypothetical protein